MHSRTRVWIPSLIALVVGSFLLGFQPIRRPPKQVVPEASFVYKFDKPLTTTKSEYEKKAQEVHGALTDGGFVKEDIEDVELVADDRVRIKTYALDAGQVAQDERSLLKTLKGKYEGVVSLGRVEPEKQEQPIAELGGVLALYRPSPKLKLGLDLQGGLHVVLRCLPYASMTFTTSDAKKQALYATEPLPEDEEDAASEGDESAAADKDAEKDAKPSPDAPTISREELEKRIVVALVRGGLAKQVDVENGYVKAKAVSPDRLVVETNAENEQAAKAQRRLVLNMLQEIYPKYTIDPSDVDSVPIGPDTAEKVKSIIDKRLFQMGDIREPLIQKQGRDQIIVEIPGVKDPERVTGILKSTALLEFRLIPQQYESASPGEDFYDEWKDKRSGEMVNWDRVLAESDAEFRGADLMPNSRVVPGGSPGSWEVTFELKSDKKRQFHEFTRRSVGRLMAIVLDSKCQMAPVIKSAIPGQGIIEGNFSTQEAGDLRLLLNAGALPVPLEIAENRTVSATLGQDTIIRSLRAGAAALIAILVFMVAYYRLPGVLANFALVLYLMVLVAIVAMSQTVRGVGGITLTLPGIAGVILSLGMAVDANILIFERLKEELRSGKRMRAAVIAGFDRAWTAILDSNITTLITASVLYFLGTSVIKSFATMLFIGVVCSMFTAITVTRWLVTMVGETKLGQNLALFGVSDVESSE